MDYIRNSDDLVGLPNNITSVKFNNYVGIGATKKLERFKRLKTVVVTPNTEITKEARKALTDRQIAVIRKKEKAGRKPLERAELPEIANAMIELLDEIKGLALVNRPITTIVYAEYRMGKNVELVTVEDNIKKIEKKLKAKRVTFRLLKARKLDFYINVVPNSDYQKMEEKSLKVEVKTASKETKTRILDKESAIKFATKNPTAHALQDALTIMFRNRIKHVTPENEYLTFFNYLAKHPHIRDKELREMRDYYAHDAPIDAFMMKEVTRTPTSSR